MSESGALVAWLPTEFLPLDHLPTQDLVPLGAGHHPQARSLPTETLGTARPHSAGNAANPDTCTVTAPS